MRWLPLGAVAAGAGVALIAFPAVAEADADGDGRPPGKTVASSAGVKPSTASRGGPERSAGLRPSRAAVVRNSPPRPAATAARPAASRPQTAEGFAPLPKDPAVSADTVSDDIPVLSAPNTALPAPRRQAGAAARPVVASATVNRGAANGITVEPAMALVDGVITGNFNATSSRGRPLTYTVLTGGTFGGSLNLDAATPGAFTVIPYATWLDPGGFKQTEQFGVQVEEVTRFATFASNLPVLGEYFAQIIDILQQNPRLGGLLAPIIGASLTTTLNVDVAELAPGDTPVVSTDGGFGSAGPSAGVKGTRIKFTNKTGQVIAVVQVPGGGAEDPGNSPQFIVPGETGYFSGYNGLLSGDDVRLRLYTATQDSAGSWQVGEMRNIVTANNPFVGSPGLHIRGDVFFDPNVVHTVGQPPGVYRLVTYIAGRESNGGFFTSKALKEGQGCHCDASKTGGSADGQAIYVARENDSDREKNFVVEVFKLSSTRIWEGYLDRLDGSVKRLETTSQYERWCAE